MFTDLLPGSSWTCKCFCLSTYYFILCTYLMSFKKLNGQKRNFRSWLYRIRFALNQFAIFFVNGIVLQLKLKNFKRKWFKFFIRIDGEYFVCVNHWWKNCAKVSPYGAWMEGYWFFSTKLLSLHDKNIFPLHFITLVFIANCLLIIAYWLIFSTLETWNANP